MENAVNKQQLTDEIYKRNFALLAPVTHLNDQSMTGFMEVINFTSSNKTKPTVAEFISDNIEQINTQLKNRGAVLIRGATDCNDSFGAIPKSISEYRQSEQKDQSKPDQKERIRIGESNSDFSIRKLILEDYFPRDPKQLDGFSVYTAGSVTPSTFIPLHNEGASFSTNLLSMPSILCFYCATPAHRGEGSTLLAKNSDVIEDIPKPVLDKIRSINPNDLVSTLVFPSRDNKVAVAIVNAILKITPTKDPINPQQQLFDLEKMRLNSIFSYWQDGLSKTAEKQSKQAVLKIAEKDISDCGGKVFFDDLDNLHVSFNLNEKMIREVNYLPNQPPMEVLYTDVPYHYSSIEVDIIKRLIRSDLGAEFIEENQSEFDRLLELIVGKSYTLNLLLSLEDHLTKEDIQSIRKAMIKNAVRFDYRQGDILIIDNFRVMHGREPHRCLDRQIKLALAM
ncbi:MAG: TauD/TfdA family dioxygenase [Porticoccaceae bacterium]|nr:TauD/TfdA family dioxygenase [Porticoccaceae bacterium]